MIRLEYNYPRILGWELGICREYAMRRIYDDGNTPKNRHLANSLLREGELLERHGGDVSAQTGHASRLSNPHNLFDDLNSEDSKWIKVARKHLKKSTGHEGSPPQSI
jgi:hypothetical protein